MTESVVAGDSMPLLARRAAESVGSGPSDGEDRWAADPELCLKVIHPDDQQRVVTETWRTTQEAAPYRTEYRIIRRDGAVVRVREEAAVVHDDGQQQEIWYGMMSDVSDHESPAESA